MASQRTYDEAMWRALTTATVDRAGGAAEQVMFDRAALARVAALYKESGGDRMMRFAWRDGLHRAVREGDLDAAWAAYVLRDRLTGATGRRYVEVEGRLEPVSDGSAAGVGDEDEVALRWMYPEAYP